MESHGQDNQNCFRLWKIFYAQNSLSISLSLKTHPLNALWIPVWLCMEPSSRFSWNIGGLHKYTRTSTLKLLFVLTIHCETCLENMREMRLCVFYQSLLVRFTKCPLPQNLTLRSLRVLFFSGVESFWRGRWSDGIGRPIARTSKGWETSQDRQKMVRFLTIEMDDLFI